MLKITLKPLFEVTFSEKKPQNCFLEAIITY